MATEAGIYDGPCNTEECSELNARWFNKLDSAYYCRKCAMSMNHKQGEIICTHGEQDVVESGVSLEDIQQEV
jgi:hypothetical protein